MRNRNSAWSWNTDPEYIVRLVRGMIGDRSMKIIIRESQSDCDPTRIRSYVWASVMPRIEDMNDETLGRICAYASSEGAHTGRHPRGMPAPKFINRFGLNDVYRFEEWIHIYRRLRPGEYLVIAAACLFTCIVADIIKQDDWQANWRIWEMTEEEEKKQQRSP